MPIDGSTASARRTMRARSAAAPAFTATLFLSAALLFLIQPMFAKMALPLLGGAPNVWNVALVFYQAVLLLGYLYAFALSRWASLPLQIGAHVLVLLLSFVSLPIGVSTLVGAPSADAPALWLVLLFGASVGLPFFAVSATAPLLQHWFSRSGRSDAGDPYYLYGASNIGSLLALMAYPALFEPTFTLSAQSSIWSGGFYLLIPAILGCGALVIAARSQSSAAATPCASGIDASRITWRRRGFWMVMAFIPSSLLLGVTTHITTDVAAAPLLWVAPLVLYLLTYVIAFSRRPWITMDRALNLQPALVVAAGATLFLTTALWALALAVHLSAFFVCALLCHQRLVRTRPAAAHLTQFYLLMSLGGVLGGAFNGLLAPVLFDSIVEYPLMLAAALLVRPPQGAVSGRARIALAVAAALAAVSFIPALPGPRLLLIAAVFVALAVLESRARPWAMALLFLVMAYIGATAATSSNELVTQERSFFGVHRVESDGDYHILSHGTTIHGVQALEGPERLRPTSYYSSEGGISRALEALRRTRAIDSVGVVGLGSGAMACNARPGESWMFFEIDPTVRAIATNDDLFGYLRGCAPDARVIIGDARLTLASTKANFDFLVLDAFSSDGVPAHLLTREALELYLSRISDEGVIVFHISNRVLDLAPPLAGAAEEIGAASRVGFHVPRRNNGHPWDATTQVFLVGKSEAALAPFTPEAGWRRPENAGRAWTDNYSNILGALIGGVRQSLENARWPVWGGKAEER